MENKVPNYLLNTIKNIYRNTKVRIECNEYLSEPIFINKRVRQGCGLSPVLFNTYINKIVQKFKTMIMKGIQLNKRKYINTMLYADDQILNGHIWGWPTKNGISPKPHSKEIQHDYI